MAKKAAKRTTKKAASGRSVQDRVIDAALDLAATKPWREISLAEIAEAAGLPLSEVYPVFPSKARVLAGFARRVDAEVLAGQEPDAREGRARDRLFDVLMRRYDALAPHKDAVRAIVADLGADPAMGLCSLRSLARSMACMLEAADLSSGGLRGALRVKALSAVYLATLRTWLSDESEDLARTMAVLDRQLRRAEWLAECCSRLRKRGGEEPAAAAEAAP